MSKYLALVASIVIQISLGGIYAWSTFVEPLTGTYGLGIAHTQLIFGFTIGIFTLAMIPAGRIQARYGPRLVATIGGALFGIGYYLASLSNGEFGLLFVGIAVVSGMGIGFGYICPLATSISWFPEQKGLITGIAVAGFGGGAVLLSNVANSLLTSGMDILVLFRWVGLVYGGLVLLMAQVLRLPRSMQGKQDNRDNPRTFTLFRQGHFWGLAYPMFAGTFAGLLVVGNLQQIGLNAGVSGATALLSVSMFAVGNASGRLLWGAFFDRLGQIVLPLSLVFLGTSVLGLYFLVYADWMFIMWAFLSGFGFGSCFVLYAAQTAVDYGANMVARIYPYVFIFYGLSGIVGPPIGGWFFDISNSYLIAVLIAALISYSGAVVVRKLLPKIAD